MQLTWQKIKLPLKETFSIAYGNYSYRNALIVVLKKSNTTGYGECTEIDYYQIKIENLIEELKKIKTIVETQKIVHPLAFYEIISKSSLSAFVCSALDCAYWDLYGKLEKKSFLELNKIKSDVIPESSITISVDSLKNQQAKINASSWNNFKVKCKGLERETLYLLSQMKKSIAIDSNGSFTKEDCEWLEKQEFISEFVYLEQPMKVGQYNILNRLGKANWMADEDFQDSLDLKQLEEHYKSINIKLVKCGGLTPALKIITEARKRQYKIMIGCMTESTVGISAGAVLAPLVDYVDLDGANLLASDIAHGSEVIMGKVVLSECPGLGISIR
ncbi:MULTISPECIES: enolase C-terminal domain-like protein [Flavobacterium]|uniref:Chloromuconate cycloisomerase n=2 Tax=Flavobacterium TaxID=237 RepID=A0A2N9PC81_9FLAO|nr:MULTISPECIES: enolase C-terminal domain-like protein [Flavobacterium]OWP83362.1 chloromuconate cycloisomerase [Flavobacterium davisii]QYS88738.1 chloromuconate cycloisomerase [Flavobacterium davisii]RVU91911.1 chloromuconate cycloisomerase [Flavobacterium columnare]SPE77923.1 L-Ala-D/L-Glu epimerase [Flavobacterium columnare]